MNRFYQEMKLTTQDKTLANAYEKASTILDIQLFKITKRKDTYTITATQDFYDYGHILLFANDIDFPISVVQNCLIDNYGVAYTKEQIKNYEYCEWLKYDSSKILAFLYPYQFEWGIKDNVLQKIKLREDAKINWLMLYQGELLLEKLKKHNFESKQAIVDFITKNMWSCETFKYNKSSLKEVE